MGAGRRRWVTALVVVLVAVVAACGGADNDARARRFCHRYERYLDPPVTDAGTDVVAIEALLVRLAPYEIADEVAIVMASRRAVAEGTPPVVPPERLATAEDRLDRWVETSC